LFTICLTVCPPWYFDYNLYFVIFICVFVVLMYLFGDKGFQRIFLGLRLSILFNSKILPDNVVSKASYTCQIDLLR